MVVLDEKVWTIIFNVCFKTIQDNQLIWFQYKVLMRILGTARLQNVMRILDSNICRLCGRTEESIMHLFTECIASVNIWTSLKTWIKNITNIDIHFSPKDIILGYLQKDNRYLPINTIIIVTKHYIFNCAQTRHPPDFFTLQKKIKNVYIEQKLLSKFKDKHECFIKQWAIFSPLFQI